MKPAGPGYHNCPLMPTFHPTSIHHSHNIPLTRLQQSSFINSFNLLAWREVHLACLAALRQVGITTGTSQRPLMPTFHPTSIQETHYVPLTRLQKSSFINSFNLLAWREVHLACLAALRQVQITTHARMHEYGCYMWLCG